MCMSSTADVMRCMSSPIKTIPSRSFGARKYHMYNEPFSYAVLQDVPSICVLNAVESSRGTAELAPVTLVNQHPGEKIVFFLGRAYQNEQEESVVPKKVAQLQQVQAIADSRNKTYLYIVIEPVEMLRN
jgi:hypothetical protein